MTPEQVTILTSLITIFKTLSTWPVASIIFIMVVGPWVVSLILAEGFRRRFERVVKMYESNVRLVEKYESIAMDLKDVVMVNTNTFATLTESIKHNQFCPIVRKDGGTG